MSTISLENVSKFRADFMNDPERVRSQNAVVKCGVDDTALNNERYKELLTSRSAFKVRLDNWDITNQKQSGRCWLFSSLNILRRNMAHNLSYSEGSKKHNGGKSFELSQSYAMFWDKLERANYFAKSIADLAQSGKFFDQNNGENTGELTRPAAFILDTVIDDGGQWNMAVNLYKKYGVVPKDVMPESISSASTARLNGILKAYLRKSAEEIVTLVNASANDTKIDDKINDKRQNIVQDTYKILATHLGTPPQSFDFSWRNADGDFSKEFDISPQEFFNKYCNLELDDYICLVNDPRSEHPAGSTIGIEYLGNVVGGDEVFYVNTDIQTMKDVAVKMLSDNTQGQNGNPVWMGCDVRPMMSRDAGFWASDLFDFSGVHGVNVLANKETRVRYSDSAMTHAMVFTGVDFDLKGKAERWRVENSWGDVGSDKGFFIMHDNWFDEYMFEIAAHISYLPTDLQEKVKNYRQNGKNADFMLPAWDPMGSLA